MRTQVGIVGAGPAGLMLSHLLHRAGIESVVVENRSRQYVQERVRAGVLEQGTVDLMNETGVGERLGREGLIHRGLELRFGRRGHRIDLYGLTGGKAITVYGQNRVVEDLTDARLAAGGRIFFAAEDVSVSGLDSAAPAIRCRADGEAVELQCDFIAGCDGFHGVCRPSIPAGVLTEFDRVYPFAWLGILAAVEPSFSDFYSTGSRAGLEEYSDTCLRRVWKVQRFSWWMTSMLHRFEDENAFDQRRQLAELEYVVSSRAASQSLAENYVGLPLD